MRVMYRRKWIGWLIGTSLVSSGLSTLPASAVPPNQSDITGTNIWNNTAPIFENGGELSPEILNNARRLSQELEDASAGCCNASAPVVEPRRFARSLGPDCQRLDSLVEETRVFLDDVNRSQAQQVRANRNRTW